MMIPSSRFIASLLAVLSFFQTTTAASVDRMLDFKRSSSSKNEAVDIKDALLSFNTGAFPNVGSGPGSYWQPANISATFPADGGSGQPNNGPVTILITYIGHPFPKDQILVGLLASQSLIYKNQYPPDDKLPTTGIEISYTAGEQHSVSLAPLGGAAVPWTTVSNVLKQVGFTVFKNNVSTEIFFKASIYTKTFLQGFLTNPKV